MNETVIDTDTVNAAGNRLSTEAATEAGTAGTNVSTLACNQTLSDKWGTLASLQFFQSRYHSYLVGLEDSLSLLKQELDDFAQALRMTAHAYETREQDVIDTVTQLRSNYEQLVADNVPASVPLPEETNPAVEGVPEDQGGLPAPKIPVEDRTEMPAPGAAPDPDTTPPDPSAPGL